MRALARWWQARVPVSGEQLMSLTNEPVPNHLKRWWFCLGGTPAYLFIVQAITGVLLTFYYVPTPEQAYESVQSITTDIRFGWYIRGLHKWSANLMIIALLLLHGVTPDAPAGVVVGPCLLALGLGVPLGWAVRSLLTGLVSRLGNRDELLGAG